MGYLHTFPLGLGGPGVHKNQISRLMKPLVLSALLVAASVAHAAQPANRITAHVDLAQARALPNHHPLWANAANDAGVVAANLPLENMTLVLARSDEQEAAFEQFLADQQNPASANYHHWLTPAEVGERFGLSAQDIDTLSAWLQSQGLHVNWVAPSRIFIGFGGTAANLGRAFQTELHSYNVNGVQRMSVASDPLIPQALAPAIKAIRGLYTLEEQPQHRSAVGQAASPQVTTSGGSHFIAPGDFATIYDLPLSYSGYGKTIGIVGRARTNFADFTNFKQLTGSVFQNPTEIVPTAFGGIDPGPALTAPPTGSVSIGDQGEATLDVLRAGSVAPNANLLLVVATSSSGGIGDGAQYLVQTSPVPAQVMTISFGACELSAGTSGVNHWDTLFQQAAAEGISVFVSSGDAGASGCDSNFSTPPAAPKANSPNYLCSSSYVTCVGGTEFNDTSNPTLYWGTGTSYSGATAQGYIPEGGWNEPLNSSSLPVAASSGGGVSTIIATPSWQTGTGVPAARSGRYTPDISFSSSCHDGYFGCFAAGGASCVSDTNGRFTFEYSCGTSAAAPSMAGAVALLDEKFGRGLGNLNPAFYQMAASVPAAFHDVTVATSGVASCDVNTPSMCNNSIPSSTGLSGGQAGFLLTAGYDEVTGLGSLDLQKFFDNYSAPKLTPTVAVSLSSSSITTAQGLTVTVALTASDTIAPTGTVTLTSGSYTSAASTVFSGSATIIVPANSLAAGSDTLTVSYAPDASGATIYNSATGSNTITVTAVAKLTPTVTVTPSASSITSAQGLTVTIAVNGGSGNQTPTGTVTLSSGSYSSGTITLSSGGATINVLAGMLAAGNDTLTVNYTPDATSTSIYNAASGLNSVTVTAVAKITPTVTVSPYPLSATTDQIISVSVAVSGGSGNQTPTGTVKLTSGSYVVSSALNGGSAFLILSAGALPAGSDTLAVSYTPDTASSSVYNSASGSSAVTITRFTPTVQVAPALSSVTTAQALSVAVAVSGGYYLSSPSGSVTLTSGSYTSGATALTRGGATIIVPAGALATGTDTLTATYTQDSTSSPLYNAASSTASVTVTAVPPPTPGFIVTASSLTLTAGATTGNTTTVTVTPTAGFSGSVALTATVSPANGTYPPTLSFGATTPVSITTTTAGTATLTIATTAPQTPICTADNRLPRGIPWYAEGGTALALVLLFGIPARRRKVRNLLGMVALAVVLIGGVASCGGGGSGGTKACSTAVTAGTTPGPYTVTVTGTSGSTIATGIVSLTVQ